MSKLFKLENGQPVPYNGQSLKLYIANPTDDQLKFAGYKPLVEDEKPEYDENTQFLKETYNETETELRKSYVVVDITSSEDSVNP